MASAVPLAHLVLFERNAQKEGLNQPLFRNGHLTPQQRVEGSCEG